MKAFGELFKTFRISRGLRLKDLTPSGVSTSQLSRFEKGETDLTVTKFMSALDEMNLPIDEFMYAAHDFHRDELNELLAKIQRCVTTKDSAGMKNLLASQLEKGEKRVVFHRLNEILLKIRLQELSNEAYYSDEDLAYLTDYLFGVEYWGQYELLLFCNTLDVLKHEVFMVLAREMVRRTDFYREIPTNRRLISSMLLNAYITCIERKEWLDARYFEEQLHHCFFTETEIYERLIFRYAQQLYQFKKEGNPAAILEMEKCIDAMRLAACHHTADTYAQHLQQSLENRSEIADTGK